MANLDLCNPQNIHNLMNIFGLSFHKNLGQNFLINHLIVEQIADCCCTQKDTTILEIGPGIGVLTKELAKRYSQVLSIEIDKGLIPLLKYTMEDFNNFKLINIDVMKANLEEITKSYFEKGSVSVCANLPYYITTPILMKLLESQLPFDNITVMIQKEVADRLCASPGSKNYGAITTVLQYYGQVERQFEVTKNNFLPSPRVDSSVLTIHLFKDKPIKPIDEKTLFNTIKAAFEQRRKTLSNALSTFFNQLTKDDCNQIIASCGFEPNIRGEKLSLHDFVILSDCIYKNYLCR